MRTEAQRYSEYALNADTHAQDALQTPQQLYKMCLEPYFESMGLYCSRDGPDAGSPSRSPAPPYSSSVSPAPRYSPPLPSPPSLSQRGMASYSSPHPTDTTTKLVVVVGSFSYYDCTTTGVG